MSDSSQAEPLVPELTRDVVLKVARLARLHLAESEVESFTSQLTQILDYVGVLDEADTEGVEPVAGAMGLNSVLREDLPTTSLSRDDALSGAPHHDGSYFLVPPILDPRAE
ncbi:MAG: Asp-tRNA(Asn)/Glu-tRNA(Gln) amidotransferase GatCAB subunit C [Planctomycetaceae bacterium]|nr:Asp-tRNA(Asn)/Glu-tRNA(Gln) amidotransferase GatCAB subunit C [Planctomycetaceae bacterium]MDP7274152.1 Asp-tRNA(Asn)/Glu-tRNA(Gln) amidotransferase subunit GatC [Planctomycetaceae bacterium]